MAEPTRLSTGLAAVPFLNERIRDRRKQLGITQRALAGHLGVDKSAMTRIEKGTQTVTPEQLAILSDKLGASIAWLVLNHGEAPPVFQVPAEDTDRRLSGPDDATDADEPEPAQNGDQPARL
jgi:transcriptional regulator with XRE-family HTH domain